MTLKSSVALTIFVVVFAWRTNLWDLWVLLCSTTNGHNQSQKIHHKSPPLDLHTKTHNELFCWFSTIGVDLDWSSWSRYTPIVTSSLRSTPSPVAQHRPFQASWFSWMFKNLILGFWKLELKRERCVIPIRGQKCSRRILTKLAM